MKAVLQRVTGASVTVGNETISSIGRGICILLGISRHDTMKEMELMVKKILNIKLFEDAEGRRWKTNVKEKNLEILCVSQFTLQYIMKGNKLDFHEAMGAEHSQEFYNTFLNKLGESYAPDKIKDGKFGAYMQVHIQNDGPVTIQVDYPPKKPDRTETASSQDA